MPSQQLTEANVRTRLLLLLFETYGSTALDNTPCALCVACVMVQSGVCSLDACGGLAWERAVPVSLRLGDKEEAVQELTLRLALVAGKQAHLGRVRGAQAGARREAPGLSAGAPGRPRRAG